jgi:hypothetical protein
VQQKVDERTWQQLMQRMKRKGQRKKQRLSWLAELHLLVAATECMLCIFVFLSV